MKDPEKPQDGLRPGDEVAYISRDERRAGSFHYGRIVALNPDGSLQVLRGRSPIEERVEREQVRVGFRTRPCTPEYRGRCA